MVNLQANDNNLEKINNCNKILVSPSSFGEISNEPLDILKKNGYIIIHNPFKRKLTEEEIIELAADCVGIVAGLEPLNSRVLDSCPKLKCISRVGVGMDNVDIEYAKQKGIAVTNTPDGPTRSVAELTLAMTMSLLRRIPQADANLKNGIWKKETGNLLSEKVIGIIGLGRIGKTVAQLFRGLGNTVIGYDPNEDKNWAERLSVKLLPFDEVIHSADIVSLHVPGSKDKKPVFTKEVLKKMKSGSFLVNVSRGGVVDEDALYEALLTNELGGAAVDVFSVEPYIGNLTRLDNIIMTPHLGSYAKEGKLKMEIDAVNNLLNTLTNK